MGPIGGSHQIDQGACSHLFDHTGAMHLDGFLGNTQFTGNLFVETAFDEKRQHLPLARRKERHAAMDGVEFDAAREDPGKVPQRVLDRAQKIGVADGLGEKIGSVALSRSGRGSKRVFFALHRRADSSRVFRRD
jgi:hypothetical protein